MWIIATVLYTRLLPFTLVLYSRCGTPGCIISTSRDNLHWLLIRQRVDLSTSLQVSSPVHLFYTDHLRRPVFRRCWPTSVGGTPCQPSSSSSWREAFSRSLPPLRWFARTVGPPLAAGPRSLLHPCRGRSGGSRWSTVGHRRVSTPCQPN